MKFARLILCLFVGAGLSANPSFAQLKVDDVELTEDALLLQETSGEAAALAPAEMSTVFYIPEPSTYGVAGAVLLTALLAARRIGIRSTALVG